MKISLRSMPGDVKVRIAFEMESWKVFWVSSEIDNVKWVKIFTLAFYFLFTYVAWNGASHRCWPCSSMTWRWCGDFFDYGFGVGFKVVMQKPENIETATEILAISCNEVTFDDATSVLKLYMKLKQKCSLNFNVFQFQRNLFLNHFKTFSFCRSFQDNRQDHLEVLHVALQMKSPAWWWLDE